MLQKHLFLRNNHPAVERGDGRGNCSSCEGNVVTLHTQNYDDFMMSVEPYDCEDLTKEVVKTGHSSCSVRPLNNFISLPACTQGESDWSVICVFVQYSKKKKRSISHTAEVVSS